MKILFLSHYFPPEVNAPASRTYEHCVRWVRAGHEVTVITCVPNCPAGVVYEGYRNRLRPQVEVVDGIRVVRVWTYVAPNAGTVRRIVNYLSYMFSAVMAALREPRPDVLVASSPQFFCGWAGVLVHWLRRVPFVLEIRDIWPESIETVGAIRFRPVLRLLQWLERRMYLAADHIVAVGEGYRGKILERLGGEGRGPEISIITNGVDLKFFRPQSPDVRFLHQWDLEGRFVCAYVGTIGMAHGLEVVIEAARRLKAGGREDIRFCLVGDGAERARLERLAQDAGVGHAVVFAGRQPKEEIPRILASSHVCLVHLRNCELFATVLPSKIFETMAMGRPMILGVNGEALRIVREAQAGIEIEPGSAAALAQAVQRLADDQALLGRLGASARQYVARHYNRDVLAGRYLRLLHKVCGIKYPEAPTAAARPEAAEPAGRRPLRAQRNRS